MSLLAIFSSCLSAQAMDIAILSGLPVIVTHSLPCSLLSFHIQMPAHIIAVALVHSAKHTHCQCPCEERIPGATCNGVQLLRPGSAVISFFMEKLRQYSRPIYNIQAQIISGGSLKKHFFTLALVDSWRHEVQNSYLPLHLCAQWFLLILLM